MLHVSTFTYGGPNASFMKSKSRLEKSVSLSSPKFHWLGKGQFHVQSNFRNYLEKMRKFTFTTSPGYCAVTVLTDSYLTARCKRKENTRQTRECCTRKEAGRRRWIRVTRKSFTGFADAWRKVTIGWQTWGVCFRWVLAKVGDVWSNFVPCVFRRWRVTCSRTTPSISIRITSTIWSRHLWPKITVSGTVIKPALNIKEKRKEWERESSLYVYVLGNYTYK